MFSTKILILIDINTLMNLNLNFYTIYLIINKNIFLKIYQLKECESDHFSIYFKK